MVFSKPVEKLAILLVEYVPQVRRNVYRNQNWRLTEFYFDKLSTSETLHELLNQP